MIENESKPELFDLIKRLPGWITGLIAFIAAIIGFIKLWQGNAGLMTTILLVLGIGGLLIICGYIVFKEIPSSIDPTEKRLAFPKLRPFAIAGLILIPFILIVGFGYRIYLKNKPPDKIIVLVADFVGPEPQKWAVTETILERLESALTNEPKARLKAVGKVITQQEGSKKAKEIGAKEKASIIIWGWYAVTEEACNISVHFDILKKQSWFPEIEIGPRLAQISELQNFVLQTRLSKELSSLTSFIVGLINLQTSAYHDAIRNFTKAIEEKSDTLKSIDEKIIYYYRGMLYYFLKEFSRAIADFSKTIALDPKYKIALNNRGIAYYDMQDMDRAISDFDQAIALDPKYALAFINRGNAYLSLKDFDRAIADYNHAIELNPKDATAFYIRGSAYIHIKDIDSAISDFNQAIDLAPKFAPAFYNRANAYYLLRGFTHAIADYDQVIALAPKFVPAFYQRGNVYYHLMNFDCAIADYDQAIALDPKYTDAFYNRGTAYFNLEKFEHAIADYTHTIALDPKYAKAYINLAAILIMAEKIAEAEQTARSVIRLAEATADQAISKYLLAVALKIQGKRTAEVDAELEQLCAKEFETGWSFDTFENWLEGVDISKEVKAYIREKTELLKKYKK